jgi:hypothetical protein
MVTVGSDHAMRGLRIVCWGEETTDRSHRIVIGGDVIVFRENVTSCRWAATVVASPLGSTWGPLTTWRKNHALMGRPRHAVAERRMPVTAAASISSDSVVVIKREETMIGRPEEAMRETRTSCRDEATT